MDEITLTINGRQIKAKRGMTVYEAAKEAEIYIPTLCHHPYLAPYGACRLCIVEIEKVRGFPISCTTPATDGMVVNTNTSQIQELRRGILELILTEHPNSCLTCNREERCQPFDICLRSVAITERCVVCPKNGRCELQKVADYIGLEEVTLPYAYKELPVERRDPLFDRDYNLCILCGRCVRICQDVRGVGAISFVQRGSQTIVGTAFNRPLRDSGCKFCGACAEVCPTGAIMDRGVEPAEREAKLVPCRSACPAGIDVPRYIRLIKEERFAEAVAVVREKVPFPATLGYICLHFCEEKCRRGELNEPIAIRALKRFAAEHDTGLWKQRSKFAPATGKRVAIIGSGPAGLTGAYYLTKLGHSVTVFEALPVAGGMMRVGIPEYRLPRQALDAEVDEIKRIGVDIRLNTKVESLDKLLEQGYDAVLLAVGAHRGVKLPVPGADLDGVLIGTSVLRDINLGKKIRIGKNVVVLGDGNIAFDCARTALRLGATDVHIVCQQPRNAMLAAPDEIKGGEEEGIIIHPLHTFTRIVSQDRHITGVECLDVRSFELDSLGELHVDAIPGSEHILPADTVIFAVGQEPDLKLIEGVSDIKTTGRRYLDVDSATLATGKEGVFAAGDAVTGVASVIEAIAAGRQAAISIDTYLGGSGEIDETLVDPEKADPYLGREEGFADKSRAPMPCLSVEQRLSSFAEVELGFDEAEALGEAKRCLQCDLRFEIPPSPFPPQKRQEVKAEDAGEAGEKEKVST